MRRVGKVGGKIRNQKITLEVKVLKINDKKAIWEELLYKQISTRISNKKIENKCEKKKNSENENGRRKL